MAEIYADGGIRRRLIEAGLKELLEHGSRDFSLRRVALGAQVSCAAPYRHFKDKDELVRAVIAQIRENWVLLASEIGGVFERGTSEHVTELIAACVRFWIAGDNFAPFLSAGELREFDLPIITATDAYAERHNINDEERSELCSALLALTYGTVTLITSKRLEPTPAVDALRKQALALLEKYADRAPSA